MFLVKRGMRRKEKVMRRSYGKSLQIHFFFFFINTDFHYLLKCMQIPFTDLHCNLSAFSTFHKLTRYLFILSSKHYILLFNILILLNAAFWQVLWWVQVCFSRKSLSKQKGVAWLLLRFERKGQIRQRFIKNILFKTFISAARLHQWQ